MWSVSFDPGRLAENDTLVDVPKHASSSRRATWFRWQAEHQASVAATCRHFGIARSTFYRWQHRAEERRLRALLAGTLEVTRERVRRGRPRLFWSEEILELVSWINLLHPAFGKRQVRVALAARGHRMSEATVGRILRSVRRRCPVCRRRGGGHYELVHRTLRDIRRIAARRS